MRQTILVLTLCVVSLWCWGGEMSSDREPPFPPRVKLNRFGDSKWYDRMQDIKEKDPESFKLGTAYLHESYPSWQPALAVLEGMVVFVQPDGSVTTIELETGRVVARTRDWRKGWAAGLPNRIFGSHWLKAGKLAGIFEHGKPPVVVDAQNGAITFSASSTIECGAGQSPGVDFHNTETLDDIVLFLSKGSERAKPFVLRCFSIADSSLLWEKSSDPDETWESMNYRDGKIYVACYKRGYGKTARIDVFDKEGTLLETLSETDDRVPESIFDTRGVGYAYAFVDVASLHASRFANVVRERFGQDIYPHAGAVLPGDGYAWIESEPEDFSVTLRYRDGHGEWTGAIGTVDNDYLRLGMARGIFTRTAAIGGDERHIVYMTRSGRMECVDRFTGASLWIYAFPRFFVYSEEECRRYWRKSSASFTRQRLGNLRMALKMCTAWENTDALRALRIDWREPPVNLILDPDPDQGYRQITWWTIVVEYVPDVVIVFVVVGVWFLVRRVRAARVKANRMPGEQNVA